MNSYIKKHKAKKDIMLGFNDYEGSHEYMTSNDGMNPPIISNFDLGRRSLNVGSQRNKLYNLKKHNVRTPLRE
jgi:hypothetical protein